MSNHPLTAAELETKLDEALDPDSSSPYATTPLAQALEPFAREQQDFVLRWSAVITRTNTQMAVLFAAQAPEALRRLTLADIENWVVRAMDVYDKLGLFPACAGFR